MPGISVPFDFPLGTSEISLEWFAFQNFNNFRTFSKRSQNKLSAVFPRLEIFGRIESVIGLCFQLVFLFQLERTNRDFLNIC